MLQYRCPPVSKPGNSSPDIAALRHHHEIVDESIDCLAATSALVSNLAPPFRQRGFRGVNPICFIPSVFGSKQSSSGDARISREKGLKFCRRTLGGWVMTTLREIKNTPERFAYHTHAENLDILKVHGNSRAAHHCKTLPVDPKMGGIRRAEHSTQSPSFRRPSVIYSRSRNSKYRLYTLTRFWL